MNSFATLLTARKGAASTAFALITALGINNGQEHLQVDEESAIAKLPIEL